MRLLTRDPSSGFPLEVTRLECPETGITIEGRFSLGWMGRLTPEQLDFVGVVLAHRANLQKVASYLGVAYNTVRSRMDEVVAALGGLPGDDSESEASAEQAAARQAAAADRARVLAELASGELSVEDAQAALSRLRPTL
ncbi:MAG TPA: DUF2089 family protein [Acidimicrobiales bacterium]|nr:DUF2089 family protein [Acidimicrobiales bacterium]